MGNGTHKGHVEVKRVVGGNTNFKESRLQRRDVHLHHGRYEPNGNWMGHQPFTPSTRTSMKGSGY